jgi:hypothetical protein
MLYYNKYRKKNGAVFCQINNYFSIFLTTVIVKELSILKELKVQNYNLFYKMYILKYAIMFRSIMILTLVII